MFTSGTIKVTVELEDFATAWCEFSVPHNHMGLIGIEAEHMVQEAVLHCLREATETPEKIYIQIKKEDWRE